MNYENKRLYQAQLVVYQIKNKRNLCHFAPRGYGAAQLERNAGESKGIKWMA